MLDEASEPANSPTSQIMVARAAGGGRRVQVAGEADDGLGVVLGVLLDQVSDYGQGFGDEGFVCAGEEGEEDAEAAQ